MSLERRTPLRRTGGLKVRKRLAPVSAARAGQRDAMADVRSRVYARDHDRCILARVPLMSGLKHLGVPRCFGGLTPHHLLKAGQGGPYSETNLVTLCAGHNGWVETDRLPATWLGLVVERGGDILESWGRLVELGLVDYWWTGGRPPSL